MTLVTLWSGERTATGYRFTFGLPPKQLSPNARGHFMKKARDTKWYRLQCGLTAASSLNNMNARKPRWERVTAVLTFYFKTPARRDQDNALASCKAMFDGLADAGLVANDSGLTPSVAGLLVDRANPRVEVVIEPVGWSVP